MIRKYENKDLEAVMTIWFKASSISHFFLNAQQLEEERGKIKEIYLLLAETWVYESKNEVVGFISIFKFEIGGLFVLPSLHRRGIGRSLVEHIRGKCQRLEVQVFTKNTLGLSFYHHMGFEPMHQNLSEAYGNSLLRLQLVKSNINSKTTE